MFVDNLDSYTINGENFIKPYDGDGFYVYVTDSNWQRHEFVFPYSHLLLDINTDTKPLFFKHENNKFAKYDIIISLICKALDVPCIEPVYASFFVESGKYFESLRSGVLMENFHEQDGVVRVYSASELFEEWERVYGVDERVTKNTAFNILNVIKDLKKVGEFRYYKIDSGEYKDVELDPNLTFDIAKLVFIDYITAQKDRHKSNIEFIIKKDNDKRILSLAPLFDNSYAYNQGEIENPQLRFTLELDDKYHQEIPLAKIISHNKIMRDFFERAKNLNVKELILENMDKYHIDLTEEAEIADLCHKIKIRRIERTIEIMNKAENAF